MVDVSDGEVHEIAVLVGNFESIDDPKAQRLLNKLKYEIKPSCLTGEAEERGLQLEVGDVSAAGTVYLDRDKMIQVLSNLIHNAIKFTPTGFIRLFVVPQGDRLEIHVKDSGPGIPKKDAEALFEPFRQLGHASQTGEKGSGLGLSLVRLLGIVHFRHHPPRALAKHIRRG